MMIEIPNHQDIATIAFGMPGGRELMILTSPFIVIGLVLLVLYLAGVIGEKR